ncbi:MAG: class I SAM-dependent methyltransferase [Anaerolineae bacterium]
MSVQESARTGWRRKLFARMYASGSDSYERLVEQRKRAFFADMQGTVVEIGAGTGANLPYYPQDVQVIAIEPNIHMHRYLREEAAKHKVAIDIRPGVAEDLGLPDESMDSVVSTLVLCSVKHQEQALAEIRRVLKPGGRFIFVEHVAAAPGSWSRRAQDVLNPAWHFIADGCNLNRDTASAIEAAGFKYLHMDHFKLPMWPTGPHVAGMAIK